MNRDEIVQAFRESEWKTQKPQVKSLSSPQVRREYARQEQLLAKYAEALPALPVSRCPICGQVLRYAFDAAGLDGMWWYRSQIVPQPRVDEPHFRLMLGAIDFHGREPAEAAVNGQVLPGPGVPFVVKRLLDMDGMQAVVSSLPLPQGDTAYLVAYFSPAPINPFELHQPWAREHLTVEAADDPRGRGGWWLATDPWDFELQPWIDAGKLKWIAPGDEQLVLRGDPSSPYVNLPGLRAPQDIRMGKLSRGPLPDGTPFDPLD